MMIQTQAWLFDIALITDDIPRQWFNRLSDQEKQRANSLKNTQRRHTYIAAHALAYRVLENFYNAEISTLRIADEGPPIVTGDNSRSTMPTPCLGLSHSGNFILCSISAPNTLSGCDIETRKPRKNALAIAKQFFTEVEYHQLLQLADNNLHNEFENLFYQCWTCKEAWLKAQGLGIANGLKKISIFQDAFRLSDTHALDWQLHTADNALYSISIAVQSTKNHPSADTVLLKEAIWDTSNFCTGKTLLSLRQLTAKT